MTMPYTACGGNVRCMWREYYSNVAGMSWHAIYSVKTTWNDDPAIHSVRWKSIYVDIPSSFTCLKYICRHFLYIQMSSHFHRTLCIAGSLSPVVFTLYSHVMTFPPHSNNIPATYTSCYRRTLWTVGSFPLLFSLYMRMTWRSRHIHVSMTMTEETHIICHMSWRSDVSSLSHLMTFPPHSRVLIVPTH